MSHSRRGAPRRRPSFLVLLLARVLLEEVEARRQLGQRVLGGVLAKRLRQLAGGLERMLPGEEVLGRKAQVLADLLASGRHRGVHEQRHRAQRGKGICQRVLVGRVVALGGLGLVAPAAVGVAAEVLGHGKRTVGVEGVGAALVG